MSSTATIARRQLSSDLEIREVFDEQPGPQTMPSGTHAQARLVVRGSDIDFEELMRSIRGLPARAATS